MNSSPRPAGTCSLALVGLGRWGTNYLRTLAAIPTARISAVVDPDLEARARGLQQAPHARPFCSLDEALEEVEIDGVVIASPSETHARLASAALSRGLAVLVEKPIATTVADAQLLAQNEHHARLLVGHIGVHHPGLQRLEYLAREGAIGNLLRMDGHRASSGAARSSEPALWALGPHDACTAVRLFGSPIRVCCTSHAPDQQVAELRVAFRGETELHLSLSRRAAIANRQVTLIGDRGVLRFDETNGTLSLKRDYVESTEEVLLDRPLLQAQCEHFLACAAGAAWPRTGLVDGIAVTRVLVAAQESAANGGAELNLDIWPSVDGLNAPVAGGIQPPAA